MQLQPRTHGSQLAHLGDWVLENTGKEQWRGIGRTWPIREEGQPIRESSVAVQQLSTNHQHQ